MKPIISHPGVAALVLIFALGCATRAQELDPKDLISRHLNSISTPERRAALKNLFAVGVSEFESKVPVIKGGGKAIVVSDPDNLYFLLSLNSHDYPYERVGAFAKGISLPFISPGRRSFLGAFLADNPKILTENLFCGDMSLRWIDNISDAAQQKMKIAGSKKINGRGAYAVDVAVSGSDSGKSRIRLYFDSDTYRHIRSEYHREVDIGRITVRQENQLQNATVDLVEEFSDFREIDGFTLPHAYKVTLTTNTATQVYEASLGIRVSTYYFNQNLAPDFFTFDVK
jgi:hypothetical protein